MRPLSICEPPGRGVRGPFRRLWTKKLVTSACCGRQYAHGYHKRLANSGKITTFTGVPLFDALVHRFL